MRILLILLLATSLLAACDNNPFANNNRKKDTRDKNDKDDRDKDDSYDDEDKDDTRSNWTKKQRNAWLDDCIEGSDDIPNAEELCSCVLKKVEKKYPDHRDAKFLDETREKIKFAKECGYNVEDEHGDKDDTYINGDDDDYDGGGGWTSQQRKQFIYGCATTAKQNQGFTAEEADSYCSCMTRKVEQKHSFKEAARMTATDFQTPEWQEAAADCLSR